MIRPPPIRYRWIVEHRRIPQGPMIRAQSSTLAHEAMQLPRSAVRVTRTATAMTVWTAPPIYAPIRMAYHSAPGRCRAIHALSTGPVTLRPDSKPDDACIQCVPTESNTAWTRNIGATVCDDGDPCTLDDVCTDTGCAGTEKPCDDELACTTDSCLGGSAACTKRWSATTEMNAPTIPAMTMVNAFSNRNRAHVNSTAMPAQTTNAQEVNAPAGQLSTAMTEISARSTFAIPMLDASRSPHKLRAARGDVALCDDGLPCTDDLCDELTGECKYPD